MIINKKNYIFSNINSIKAVITNNNKIVEIEKTQIILKITSHNKNKLNKNHCLKLEKIWDKNTSHL